MIIDDRRHEVLIKPFKARQCDHHIISIDVKGNDDHIALRGVIWHIYWTILGRFRFDYRSLII